MRSNIRVAGITAAALLFGLVAAVAPPTLAAEAETAPAVHYIQHASASLDTGALGLNRLEDGASLAHDVHFSNPVAAHAVAEFDTAEEQARDVAAGAERDGRSLSELVRAYAGTETPNAEFECLATAIYYESKGESLVGQLTVAEVILNRSESGRFPSSICGVVKQPSQFSFVRGGRLPTPPRASQSWRTAVGVAHVALNDLAEGEAPRAMFFHARRVSPGWRNLTRVATVGNHVFYR